MTNIKSTVNFCALHLWIQTGLTYVLIVYRYVTTCSFSVGTSLLRIHACMHSCSAVSEAKICYAASADCISWQPVVSIETVCSNSAESAK